MSVFLMSFNIAMQMQNFILRSFECLSKYNEHTFAEGSDEVVLKHLRMYERELLCGKFDF